MISLARRSLLICTISLLCVATHSGCRKDAHTTAAGSGKGLGGAGTISIQSTAFGNGQPIPSQFSADGGNQSPPLQWSGAPAGTKEFVLIVEERGAKSNNPFVHWIAFGIPGGATSLPADAGNSALVTHGTNSAGETGYTGPRPAAGKPQRYSFQLFALREPSELTEGADRAAVERALAGKVLAGGVIVGTFQAGK